MNQQSLTVEDDMHPVGWMAVEAQGVAYAKSLMMRGF